MERFENVLSQGGRVKGLVRLPGSHSPVCHFGGAEASAFRSEIERCFACAQGDRKFTEYGTGSLEG